MINSCIWESVTIIITLYLHNTKILHQSKKCTLFHLFSIFRLDPMIIQCIQNLPRPEVEVDDYQISCLLMVFVAVSIPRLAKSESSIYKVSNRIASQSATFQFCSAHANRVCVWNRKHTFHFLWEELITITQTNTHAHQWSRAFPIWAPKKTCFCIHRHLWRATPTTSTAWPWQSTKSLGPCSLCLLSKTSKTGKDHCICCNLTIFQEKFSREAAAVCLL